MIDHNKNLENLFKRLREKNCKLNKEKLKLCVPTVKLFGHILTTDGLKADDTKLVAIKNMPSPTCKEDLKRFFGMVVFLSRYIRNLCTYAGPLRELTRDDTDWKWTKSEELEFTRIKDIVSNISTLKYYDIGKPLIIESDASAFGLGAVLYQDKGVVAYASRTLTKTEKNYAQIEKELLAIVFACTRFDQMIAGNHNILEKTVHRPLINIFLKPLLSAPKRLQF